MTTASPHVSFAEQIFGTVIKVFNYSSHVAGRDTLLFCFQGKCSIKIKNGPKLVVYHPNSKVCHHSTKFVEVKETGRCFTSDVQRSCTNGSSRTEKQSQDSVIPFAVSEKLIFSKRRIHFQLKPGNALRKRLVHLKDKRPGKKQSCPSAETNRPLSTGQPTPLDKTHLLTCTSRSKVPQWRTALWRV